MSDAVSIKSRADDIMNEVMAEEESKYSQSSQSRRPSNRSQVDQSAQGSSDSNEEDEDSDDEGYNVFYKSAVLIHQPKGVERQWLRKHGKSKYIDFDDKQMAILKDCFNDLDDDGSAAIGVDELEDPLIALGLLDTRQQVQSMVDAVDEDGEIEFQEFLKLVKGGGKAQSASDNGDADVIFNFFQKLTNGELQSSKEMKIGFGVYYSQ